MIPDPEANPTVTLCKYVTVRLALTVLSSWLEKNTMKPSTKDQIAGTVNEVKGKVKEKVGQVTNNPNLAHEGQAQNVGGKIQKKVGQIEKVLGA